MRTLRSDYNEKGHTAYSAQEVLFVRERFRTFSNHGQMVIELRLSV